MKSFLSYMYNNTWVWKISKCMGVRIFHYKNVITNVIALINCDIYKNAVGNANTPMCSNIAYLF